jgi:hypothetical protein
LFGEITHDELRHWLAADIAMTEEKDLGLGHRWHKFLCKDTKIFVYIKNYYVISARPFPYGAGSLRKYVRTVQSMHKYIQIHYQPTVAHIILRPTSVARQTQNLSA